MFLIVGYFFSPNKVKYIRRCPQRAGVRPLSQVKQNKASYSRSTTKLNGGERTGSTVGVLQQVLNGDTDRHDSDRVGVGLIEHGTQTLNGLSFC